MIISTILLGFSILIYCIYLFIESFVYIVDIVMIISSQAIFHVCPLVNIHQMKQMKKKIKYIGLYTKVKLPK